ncbi:MAG: hypothetical protein ACI9SC_003368 [Gammaproteobacteria bacterium]|jgi:hypothetical protein
MASSPNMDLLSAHLCCAAVARGLQHCSIKMTSPSAVNRQSNVFRTDKAPLIFKGNAARSGLSFRRRVNGGYTIAMTDYLEVLPSAQSFRELGAFLPLLRVAHKNLNSESAVIGKNAFSRPVTEKTMMLHPSNAIEFSTQSLLIGHN